jgi:hypothetical protein
VPKGKTGDPVHKARIDGTELRKSAHHSLIKWHSQPSGLTRQRRARWTTGAWCRNDAKLWSLDQELTPAGATIHKNRQECALSTLDT